MNLNTLETDLRANVNHLKTDLTQDLKAEVAHVIDPSQCGVVVQNHIDGLMFTVLTGVAGFLAICAIGIYFFA